MPAREIRDRVSQQIWSDYFTFCVERNPWDKTLSHYHMLRFRSGGNLSLEDYFEQGRFCRNYGRYTDGSGQTIVDRILKYEKLNDELAEVFGSLGIPYYGDLGVRAKGEYRTDRRHYREILNREQRDKIGAVFESEIALFGYRF